jgi:membrane protease YdiL (CAAX protease family)
MTMPGLSEEPLYRGLYPLIITLILGKKTPLRYIIPIILFTAAHVIYFDPGAHAIRYSFAPIIPVTIFAIVATYLKEKCQSIYPSILMHNLVNTFIFI